MRRSLGGMADIGRLADAYADARFSTTEDGTPLFIVISTGNRYVLLDEQSAARLRRRWRTVARIGIWSCILALLLIPFTPWGLLPLALGFVTLWFGPTFLARGRKEQYTTPERGYRTIERCADSLGTDTVVRLMHTACAIGGVLFAALLVTEREAPGLIDRGQSAELLGLMLTIAIAQLLRLLRAPPQAPSQRVAEETQTR